ncbi:MAG: sulfurtransferase TusA family protein [Ezakiella sp.]|uniref:sulfurtransferase TusA family protein n=1 Tax=Ezakiella sp. TaxID=1935205 RepID=UPI002975250C|nr:sulfurtransferase TusA family protein [Ezakiella sp.]MDD7731636.1 sulfurtransferase TusA family protein [Eubacteriales bacterium]MDY6080435.1 sulfurtransferase TusA family protein [Ezakiella sp.]
MLDTRGYACPEPVIMTKDLVDKGEKKIEVMVDTTVAKENVSRFLISNGYKVTVSENNDEFTISAMK